MGAVGPVQPARLDRQHPGPQPDGPGPDRVDRLRGRDRAGPEGRRRSSRSGSLSDTVEPGQDLKAFVTLKPFKGEREIVELVAADPRRLPRGALRGGLLRHGQQPPPPVPQRAAAGSSRATSTAFMQAIRIQTEPKRTAVYLHVPAPERGLAVQGQALPNLPGSVRAVFASKQEIPEPADPLRPDRGRPRPPGSSRARSRSGSPWPRTPGSRYR